MAGKNNVEKIYSLSPMQEGMLFHSLIDKTANAYFQQATFKIEGNLNIDIMQKSLDVIVHRYDIFRTVFLHENIQIPKQVVLKDREIKITYKDITNFSYDDKCKFIEDYQARDRSKTFDISRDVLLRLSVYKVGEDEFTAVWSNHHILMDGWCVGVILQEIFQVYNSIKENKPIVLQKEYPYSNFIKWLEKKNKSDAASHWKDVIKDYTETATLPVLSKVDKGSYIKEEHIYSLDRELTEQLCTFAVNNHITLYSILQTIWGIILQRYNNTNDVIFGSIVSGRPPEIEHIEKIIGLFINVVPIRVKCDGNLLFVDLLKEVQNASIMAEKYSYYPLYSIQQQSDLKNNLFDHILVYENYPSWNEKNLFGFKISDFHLHEQTSYDFDIDIKKGDQLQIRVSYNANVYQRGIINSLLCNFEAAVRQIILNPLIKIKEIDILNKEERDKITLLFKGKDIEFEKDKTIFQMIEDQAERTPDRTAVTFGSQQYTYRELNERANRIARYLKGRGFSKGNLSGIMLERSPLMLESILGVWKAGGAYIPIDTAYPRERIITILNDSNAKVLLTSKDYISSKPELKTEASIIDLDACEAEIENQECGNLDIDIDTRDLAYVIYTSGSTGKPKGAMVEHIGMHNHINAKIKDLGVTSESVLVQNASHCFDISVWQFFTALMVGGRTVIYPKELCMDVQKFVNSVEEDGVTILEVVPSFLAATLDYLQLETKKFNRLKFLVVTGEMLKPSLARKWFELYPYIKLVNAYGPTEASDDITHYIMDKVPEYESIPIGKAMQNFNIYIVDQWMNLCPIGVKGEICVSGIGIGKGYLNDEEKTMSVFVEDPFSKIEGVKMYKTGDIGRWLEDGNIEFFGRKDYQVKIRGFRIEPGEIESKLTDHEKVKEAIVIEQKDENGINYLCGYIVTDEKVDAGEIKAYLEGYLPDYMIPAYIISMEKMPLNLNGKLDRKALPKPNVRICDRAEYQPPTNKIEERLVEVWQDVLGVNKIGISDDFFEMGGDSIKAIQISSRLQKYDLKIDIQDFFKYQTIDELSKTVKYIDKKAEQGIITGEVELTPIQAWFFQQKFTNMHHWNQAVMLYSENGFDESIVRTVFNKLVMQHDALRMVYKIDSNSISQSNRGMEGELFGLEVIDFMDVKVYSEKIEQESTRLQEGMNLSNGPLVKIGLFKSKYGDYLMVAIHHLVVDGISWRILLEDFASGYKQVENKEEIVLQDKTTSFKEWAQLLNRFANSRNFNKQIEYWRGVENTTVSELPKNNIVEVKKMIDADIYKVKLSKDDTDNLLTKVNKTYSTEIDDILLTALGISIKNWSYSNRVLVSLESHGREEIIPEANITRTVGWFTTQYPVILEVERSNDLPNQIKIIKEYLHSIPDNGMSYGILKYLAKQEDKDYLDFKLSPEISFNYLGQLDENIGTDLLKLSKFSAGCSVSGSSEMKYVLEIDSAVVDGQFEVNFKYNNKQYNRSTIANLVENYISSLKQIIDHCMDKESIEFTPSDFGSKDISLEEFENINDLVDSLE